MILCFFLILSQNGGSEYTPQDSSVLDTVDVIHYSAKTIVFDLEKSLIRLYDSSRITYQDITLLSDSAYYHIKLKHLEAFSRCHLRQLDDSIKGNYLRYNIASKKALMTGGRTQIEQGYINGERIVWVDERTVNAYNGYYTTCSDSPPHYYFYSPKMKVYLDDMVIARPIILYIEGYPVLAAPFWFVPISSKRKSGLLPFRAGNSSTFGKYIKGLSYYLVLSDYADITIQLDAMEKKGVMPHLEGVWDFAPFTKGTAYGSYIREIDTKIERYNIKFRNVSEYFLFGSQFSCDMQYLSDNSYDQDYADTTLLWLKKEITSQATISKSIIGFKNTVIFERHENFSDSIVTEKMPFYSVTSPSRLLFSSISYSLSGHVNRSRSSTPQYESDIVGANIHTAPSLQQNILHLFTVAPHVVLDYAVFDSDTVGNRWPTRFGYSFGATASTNLYRVFNTDVFGVHGILHTITPSIAYSYTPDFNFSMFPTVSGIPQFSKTHGVTFGINQTVDAKVGEDMKKVTFVRTNASSGYNFITDSLSLLSYSAELAYNPFPKPLTAFSVQVIGSVNPYSKDYTYTLLNNTTLTLDFFTLTLNQSYTKDGVYQVWFNGEIKPTMNWSIVYGARYDWDNKKLVDYNLRVKRNLHCWEAVFNINQLGDSWRYDFKVYIKDIPDVSIGKGLLGSILD
jgi:lipopolysaccharide assembly outer membrane protein LptD (OstA)